MANSSAIYFLKQINVIHMITVLVTYLNQYFSLVLSLLYILITDEQLVVELEHKPDNKREFFE